MFEEGWGDERLTLLRRRGWVFRPAKRRMSHFQGRTSELKLTSKASE